MIKAIGTPYLIAGGALLALVIYLGTREKGYVNNLMWNAGGAVVDAADGFIGGSVNAIGDLVGLERTNISQCEADLAAGRTWDASFSCPAGKFLGSFF